MDKYNSAVILAGGKSTRMGFDKQLLKSGTKRIIEHLIIELEQCFSDIMISSSSPELYDLDQVTVIGDVYKDIGPLGGIHSALLNSISAEVFVIACDMPFIDLAYIEYMISLLQKGRYHACVTSRQGYLEPFHAFYCRPLLPLLEIELAHGRYSVNRLLKKANALIIPEEKAALILPSWRVFTNINTPEEYEEFFRGESIETN